MTEMAGYAPGDTMDAETVSLLTQSGRELARGIEQLDWLTRPMPAASDSGPVSPSDLARQMGALVRYRHSGSLEIDPALGGLPAMAGVEELLTHALLNLVLNGLEAIGERPNGVVRVSGSADGRWVALAVEDNGDGVDERMIARLFTPFATTKVHPLSGLGLSTGRYLIRRFGGDLALDRPRGGALGGARFVARLPCWERA